MTKERAAEPTSNQWTTHEQLGHWRGKLGLQWSTAQHKATLSWAIEIRISEDTGEKRCSCLLCAIMWYVEHILFTSSEDLRLQNPASKIVYHTSTKRVSTEFFHKRWLYDDSWSARTRSKLTLTNLRPRGNKGPKLTWQGAWHENTKGTAQMRSFFVNVDDGSEAGACW